MGNPTGGQLLGCSPTIALRLQQLYQTTLRHFDQAYISSTQARSLQTSGQARPQPPQRQAELPQLTEVAHETLLEDVPLEASPLTSEVMRLLPQFSGTPGAKLETKGSPQPIIAFVGPNKEYLQPSAQGQSGFYAGVGKRPESAQPVHIAQPSQASGNQGLAHPSVQSIPNYQQQLAPQQVCLTFLHRTIDSSTPLASFLFPTCLLESQSFP